MERGRLIFQHNFTESEGSVVYKNILSQKFVASSSTLIALVCVYLNRFSIKCLHRTLCFSVEFSFSLYQVNDFVFGE